MTYVKIFANVLIMIVSVTTLYYIINYHVIIQRYERDFFHQYHIVFVLVLMYLHLFE